MSFFDLFSPKKKDRPQNGISNEERLVAKTMIEAGEPLFTISHRSIDPDENVPSIKGASLSYLDAKALNFWDGRRTDFKVPDHYANSAFGRNVTPALTRLLNNGYLTFGDIRKRIALKQVPELKAVLSEHELKVSGRKAELIQRIIDNIPSDELNAIFPINVYEITDKGRTALKDYSIFFDNESLGLHFSHYRLIQEKEKTPHADNESIFVRMLAEDINKALKSNNSEQYRIAVQNMAQLMDTIGRPSSAMQYHCLSFFMFWYRNTVTLGVNSPPEAYGYTARRIDSCGQICEYSLDRTLQEFQQALKTHNPFGLCTSRNINSAINAFKSALSVQ